MQDYTIARTPVRFRANTTTSALHPEPNMADTQRSRSDPGPEDRGKEQQTEKFPDLQPLTRKPSTTQKTRSLTSAELLEAIVVTDTDRTAAIDRMKSAEAPLSLTAARKRRKSVKETHKEVRKASIELIRSRTASRASACGRPNLEDIRSE